MNHSKIILKNMVFYGKHGVYTAEKELGQRYEVDLELVADFSSAGQNDDLNQTINYAEVYQLVKEIVEAEKYNLIEAIGTAIIRKVGGAYDLEEVTVRVRKPQPPVGGLMDAVEFEMTDFNS